MSISWASFCHSCEGQNYKINITELKWRCQQHHTPSRWPRWEFTSWPFWTAFPVFFGSRPIPRLQRQCRNAICLSVPLLWTHLWHRHDRRGREAELERGAWRRLMPALLSWQRQDGLEAPLPGAAPPALPGFQSLWGEARGSGGGPENTGGVSGWQPGRRRLWTCQINGLLEKTCPDPWIERWGNWVLRRKVVRTNVF